MAVNQEKQRREVKRKVKEVPLRKAGYSKSLYHLHHHNIPNRHFVRIPNFLCNPPYSWDVFSPALFRFASNSLLVIEPSCCFPGNFGSFFKVVVACLLDST